MIISIDVAVHADCLFEEWDGPMVLDKVDIPASTDRFAAMLQDRIEGLFPETMVHVRVCQDVADEHIDVVSDDIGEGQTAYEDIWSIENNMFGRRRAWTVVKKAGGR